MKYLPLIWAALRRKPARTLLTFISVIIAFTLFGMTLGVSAGLQHLAKLARTDRLYVTANYGAALTESQRGQIARLAGVRHIGTFATLAGYHQDPANPIALLMLDRAMQAVMPDLSLTQAEWHQLDGNGLFFSRAMAARYHAAPGDDFPVLTRAPSRADGSRLWNFHVLGVVDDIALYPMGFTVGSYNFLDQSRLRSDRGKAGQFWVLAKGDPDQAAQAIDRLFANSAAPTRSQSEKSLLEEIGGPNSTFTLGAEAVAGIGFFMILLLTANAIGQSVRERIPEFAVLKTLGFTTRAIIALVFAEAALPCLTGAAIGLALARYLCALLPHLLPAGAGFPLPYMSPALLVLALLAALLLALVSTALPALRLARLDVATALARR